MTTWYVGIDESGDFYNDKWSFAGAVVTQKNSHDILSLYRQFFREGNFGTDVPIDNKLLKNFHYNRFTSLQKSLAKKLFVPIIKKIIVSNGCPPILSNQQHWWAIAVQSVILRFFQEGIAQPDDEIIIKIDRRANCVLGLYEDISSNAYHRELISQYNHLLNTRRNNYNISIEFGTDERDELVNLADLTCGFFGTIKSNPLFKDLWVETLCSNIDRGLNPSLVVTKNPRNALSIILNNLLANHNTELLLIEKVFEYSKNNNLLYESIWREINFFMSELLANRGFDGLTIDKLKKLREYLISEFNANRSLLSTQEQYSTLKNFVVLDTHSGITRSEIRDELLSFFKTHDDVATRNCEKWEQYVQILIASAQISFNSYRFEEVKKEIDHLWDIQKKLTKLLNKVSSTHDETTAEITGTLGQAYAFMGDNDMALEFFEEDYKNCVKSHNIPASFIGVIYHKKREYENTKRWFEKQTKMSLADFENSISQQTDSWFILSYFRLRALAMDANINIPSAFPDFSLWKRSGSYPWPLILKWAAFCKAKTNDNAIASTWLSEATKLLISAKSDLTILSLSLPIMQMNYLLSNRAEITVITHQYDRIKEPLMKEDGIKEYITTKEPRLSSILTDDTNLWDRAVLLPFNYS